MKVIDFLYYYLVLWFEKRGKAIDPISRAAYVLGIFSMFWIILIDGIIEYLLFKSFKSTIPLNAIDPSGYDPGVLPGDWENRHGAPLTHYGRAQYNSAMDGTGGGSAGQGFSWDIVDKLGSSENGGSWSSSEGIHYFESEDEALGVGMAYVEYFHAWEYTEYKSFQATKQEYLNSKYHFQDSDPNLIACNDCIPAQSIGDGSYPDFKNPFNYNSYPKKYAETYEAYWKTGYNFGITNDKINYYYYWGVFNYHGLGDNIWGELEINNSIPMLKGYRDGFNYGEEIFLENNPSQIKETWRVAIDRVQREAHAFFNIKGWIRLYW
jgi:hypothetical protein